MELEGKSRSSHTGKRWPQAVPDGHPTGEDLSYVPSIIDTVVLHGIQSVRRSIACDRKAPVDDGWSLFSVLTVESGQPAAVDGSWPLRRRMQTRSALENCRSFL